jgi:hypothetical protein
MGTAVDPEAPDRIPADHTDRDGGDDQHSDDDAQRPSERDGSCCLGTLAERCHWPAQSTAMVLNWPSGRGGSGEPAHIASTYEFTAEGSFTSTYGFGADLPSANAMTKIARIDNEMAATTIQRLI